MVALPRLFERRQVGVEVFLGEPGGAVEPLELGIGSVSLPVGSGNARELDGSYTARTRRVRPTAEVDKFPLAVERERGVCGEPGFDVLDFQRLVQAPDDLNGFCPGHLHPLEGLVGLDDPPHLHFDRRQILVGDWPTGPHVVIKAFAHGRAEGEFHPFEEPHHRTGHHMRR